MQITPTSTLQPTIHQGKNIYSCIDYMVFCVFSARNNFLKNAQLLIARHNFFLNAQLHIARHNLVSARTRLHSILGATMRALAVSTKNYFQSC